MAAKTKTHRRESATERPMADMADKTRKNYEQALLTGQRFQEQANQWWTRIFSQASTTADWQKQFTSLISVTNSAMPLAQRRMEELIALMEKNSRTGAELLKQAAEAAQTPNVAESQAKWLEVWTSLLQTAQSNMESFTEISTKAIDSWMDFVRKNSDLTEVRMPRLA